MIKVIHISTSLKIGGAEMMLYKVLLGSDKKRFSHCVISLLDDGEIGRSIKQLGIPVYSLNMKRSIPSFSAVLRLARMVRSLQPDIIQGWMYHGNLLSLVAMRFLKRRIPLVWNIRQSLYSLSYEKRLTRMVIRCGAFFSGQATHILYNSSAGAGHHHNFGYNVDKSVIIPNGFDTEVFVPSQEARSSVREELGVDGDTILIGLIGRYHAMKDHQTFLQAASILLMNHPNIHFLLAGTDVTAQNNQLTSLIRDTEHFENIHFMGERYDIPRLTAALDCAALSSIAEGFPNVVGEAMSCCVPCVVTDVGDAARIVGDTGFVVSPRDPGAMALALGELVRLGAEGRKVLGKQARQRIMDNYSLHAVVQCYEQLYENILSK